MSVLWCRRVELCVMAMLCLGPGWRAVPVSSAEPAPCASVLEIRIVKDVADRPTALEFLGCPKAMRAELKGRPDVEEALAQIFSIHVADEKAKVEQPAMLGTFALNGDVVRFTPRYPFRPGMEYRVTARTSADKLAVLATGGKEFRAVTLFIKVPEESALKKSEVERVYPSAAILPENHLRFYIHFSQPMSRGEAYERIHLLDQNGRPVEHAFLELGEELWDATGRRLTLLIDPGRIKRGLKPREELGPVLEAGHEYALVIDAEFADAAGRPLAGPYRKSFNVAEAVTTAIEPKEWKVQPPRVGSTATLIVRFPRALDRALMERTLAVVDERGASIPGRVLIGNDEQRWEYLPDQVWQAGPYQLVIDPVLEDVAGNQVGRPFEVDEKKPAANKTTPLKVRIPFMIAKEPTPAAAR